MVKIKQLCDGVYQNIDAALGPGQVEHEGKVLHRFMDSFYIRCETEDLTPVEVSELCRARASNPAMIGDTNAVVQKLFRALILQRRPKRLLEIGAGLNPILRDSDLGLDDQKLQYVKCDADPDNTNGQNVFSGMNPVLPYGAAHFDMAIAVFVLHFHFYARQIEELHRCLAPSGVFFANVYRRTQGSLDRLAQSVEDHGLFVKKLPDPRALCHGHQYWVISKDVDAAMNALSQLTALASLPSA